MKSEAEIGVAIVGFGNWGPRVARNLDEADGAVVRVVCDSSPEARLRAARRHPAARVVADYAEVLRMDDVDAVYIATPVGTHADFVLAALESGRDVLVEKPLTASSASAEACVRAAEERGRILMVGHTFIYSPPVRKLREILADGSFGPPYYVDSSRVNLGLFQKDVSVVWDLAPHDLSIVQFVSGRRPTAVSCFGRSVFGAKDLEDVVLLNVQFEGGLVAFLHLSWLAPVKLRRTAIVCEKKMVVYDDIEPVEKIKIYDRRVERLAVTPSFGDFQLTYRFGDVLSPVVGITEPLQLEVRAFLDAIRSRKAPESDGRLGLDIVRVLEAATTSLREGSGFVPLG